MQIVVNSGIGDFASCAEMEFYKKNPDPFDYSVLFTDASCSELKPGVTEEDIQNCNYSFFKNIAYYMYRQKYPREFRIAEFKAYPHPDIQLIRPVLIVCLIIRQAFTSHRDKNSLY